MVCTLPLTKKFLKQLDVLQLDMVTIVTRGGRRPNECWLEWYKRTRRAARSVIHEHGYHAWSNDAMYCQLMWAGHVARLPGNRSAQIVHNFKDLRWWRRRQALSQLCNDGRHPGRIHPRRWESLPEQFFKAVGKLPFVVIPREVECWKDLAQDRDGYRIYVSQLLRSM